MEHHVVPRSEWLEARKALLRREKEFTRLRDEINAERLALPWVKVDKDYVFDTPGGKKTLAELFDGRSQLVSYHFMFGPDWEAGCPGCSDMADPVDGTLAHLNNHDVTLVMVSRAPLAKIEAYKTRMGWSMPWVSSFGSEFNFDYQASVTKEEADLATSELDAREKVDLDAAYGVVERGRRPREYGPALKRLEEGQRTRAKRRQLDMVDRGLMDLVSVYRDAIALATGAPGQLVNEEIRGDVRQVAATATPEILDAREQMLEFNVPPALALESMMVALKVPEGSGR